MAEVIGKVTDQEKEEIKELFEKKAALESLKNLNLNETVSMRVDDDLDSVKLLMQDWWQKYAQKYNWKGMGSNKNWEISFSTGEILLV